MTNPPSVAAVVVTYNRMAKLKKVLSAIERQTVAPQTLIIVDNASDDGTAEYLRAYEATGSETTVRVVTLDSNTGGAGGFSRGIEEAYNIGAEYVWLFDDDGYPEPDALEKLLVGITSATETLNKEVPFACSLVKYIDGSICEMNNPETTWDWGRLIAKGQQAVLVKSCSFVSVLIPRWAIQQHGLPYKEYFIWFDDAEYTLRLSKDCPGVEVLDSIIIHDMGINKGVNFGTINQNNAWKFSYGIRNQASYWLHHQGFIKYLIFCARVCIIMRRGGVKPSLRLQMYRQMVKAIWFNPAVDHVNSQNNLK